MATLTINGQKVTVDDSFLSLPPDRQSATVDEIAKSLGPQSSVQPRGDLASRLAGGQQSDNIELGNGVAPETPNLMNSTAATVNGIVNGIPVLGPLAQGATDNIGGLISQALGGQSHDAYIQHQKDLRAGYAKSAPMARLSGELGGSLASYGGLAKLGFGGALGLKPIPKDAKLLEQLGVTGGNVVNGTLSTLALGTSDSIARGDKPTDALAENVLPSLVTGGLPIVGFGARKVAEGIGNSVVRPIASMFNRDNEATKRLTGAIEQDLRVGGNMTPQDEAVAAQAGVPVMNADRFGSATRGLARTAANIDQESKGKFVRAITDRFAGQTIRAVDYIKGLMGGATDDLALQDSLKAAADKSNGLAYAKAYHDPKAAAVWTPQIKELMQSDTFRKAVDAAESTGTDRAAISGFKAAKNPFEFRPDGTVTLKVNADGSRALPSLQFWDQVKRNLDSKIGTAQRAGDKPLVATLTGLKAKLVASVDQQVPSYALARKGAAGFFGADDAIEAGRKALSMDTEIPELTRAHAKFSPAERDAASVGYASQMIDQLKAAGDNRNVFIQKMFNSPAARERNILFLGKQRASELEAYVRVESIVDQLRGAVTGNSTTAQQLISAGVLGGAGGYFGSGGNLQTGLTVGALAGLGRRGLQVLGKRVDEEVMKKVAEVLLSGDKTKIQRAILNASLSQTHMLALEGIMRGLAITSRAGVATGSAELAAAQ